MALSVKRCIIWFLLAVLLLGEIGPVLGQTNADAPPEMMIPQRQPPMENVFWNVLWGSLCGGMLLVGWATMDDSKETSERYSFGTLSTQFLTGATYGGLLGLTAGVYFSIKGISFDENLTRIAFTPNTNQVPEELRYNAFTKPKSASGKIHLMNLQIRF